MKKDNIVILNRIDEICKEREIKLTDQRRTVLDLMLSAESAMSAYELLDLLKISEPKAKPPTIYRVLDFLLAQGFIHKVESLNSFIMCPHFGEPEHISILLICNNCKKIFEKHSCEIESQLKKLTAQDKFEITHSVLEIHGICDHCQ